MDISNYIENTDSLLDIKNFVYPWDITDNSEKIVQELIQKLNTDYKIENNIAIHKGSIIEPNVTFKGPVIVGKNCFIASGAYLRGGVFLGENVKIGPSCEVKSSFVFSNSNLAHLNYVGNSLVGSNVNLEAGSVIANRFNEREDKTIKVTVDGKEIILPTEKFGSLIGDHSKIGANAVISPGIILKKKSVVGRLELITESKF